MRMKKNLWLQLEPLLGEWQIKSVIVRQGSCVADEWHASGRDTLEPIYSCTKSALSALFGFALQDGSVRSLEQPISDFFAGKAFAGPKEEERWSGIRIRHLLTMTPGFDWPDFDKPYKPFRASSDPIGFVLTRPLRHEPGEAFTYNSGASHLLSAILTQATGMPAHRYGKERLFEPLGFRAVRWSARDGICEGGTGMALYGHDLAKLGALYMQGGLWEGRRLLPEEWISESTRMHHKALLHYKPPVYGGYGYHWWCSPKAHNGCADSYFAFGHGGQYLLVVPEAELVIVVRKKITKRNDAILSRKLIYDYIVPRFAR